MCESVAHIMKLASGPMQSVWPKILSSVTVNMLNICASFEACL